MTAECLENARPSPRQVPNRTQERQWEEVQAKVEVSERRLAEQQEAVANLQSRLAVLQATVQIEESAQTQQIAAQQTELDQRRAAGRAMQRCAQGLQRLKQALDQWKARGQRQVERLQAEIARRLEQRAAAQQELAERQAARAAVDTDSLCRERDLQEDQLMLDLQVLLASLHDWVRHQYLAPMWQPLELDTAIQMIYRKPGRVTWGTDQIEVVLEPYRYADQQWAMEETCQRFNAAQRRWRDGRLIRIRVASNPKFQLCDCQGAGQT